MKPNLMPKECNLCGGEVVFTTNAEIYGRERWSGKCYLCKSFGAYVGTREMWPTIAEGILADAKMRRARMRCHELFDIQWKGQQNRELVRTEAYARLAREMGIPAEECHFGFFTMEQLEQALAILEGAHAPGVEYD